MTPADDLPPLPKSSRGSSGYWGWSGDDMRAYALAARAERDAEIERLRAALSASQRLQAAYKVAADVGDYPEQIAQRDAEIERLHEQIALRDKALNARSLDKFEAIKRAEAAEKLVAELQEKLMVMCVAQIKEAEPAVPERLYDYLMNLQVGGCTCGVKTPDFEHHAERCHFRMAFEIMLRLKPLRPSPDPPAPAPLAAQGVEGEPQHER